MRSDLDDAVVRVLTLRRAHLEVADVDFSAGVEEAARPAERRATGREESGGEQHPCEGCLPNGRREINWVWGDSLRFAPQMKGDSLFNLEVLKKVKPGNAMSAAGQGTNIVQTALEFGVEVASEGAIVREVINFSRWKFSRGVLRGGGREEEPWRCRSELEV